MKMRLPKLGRTDARKLPTLTAGKAVLREPPPEDKFAPRGLSGSREEEWIRQYLAKRRGYWYQQRAFGNPNESGSTIADFVSDVFRATIYPEGIFVHRNRLARDMQKYSLVRKMGYRVFVFYFPTFEYVVENFPKWYNENFTS